MAKSLKTSSLKKAFGDYFNTVTAFGVIIFILTAFSTFILNDGLLLIECLSKGIPVAERFWNGYDFSDFIVPGIIATVGAAALTLSKFSFLQNKSACTQYLSFGISRKKLFTKYILYSIIPVNFAALLGAIPEIVITCACTDAAECLPFYFLHIIKALLFGAAAGVAASVLCGKIFEAAFTAFSFLTVITAVFTFTLPEIFRNFLYGFTDSQFENIIVFDPLFGTMPPEMIIQLPYNTVKYSGFLRATLYPVIWILLFSVLLFVIKRYFVKKYNPVKAGAAGQSKLANTVLCFDISVFSFGCILYGVGYTLLDKPIVLTCAAIISLSVSIAFAIAFCSPKRTLKKWLLPAASGPVAIAAAVIICITGGFGYAHKTPDLEDIDSVVVSSDILVEDNFDRPLSSTLTTPEDIYTLIKLQESVELTPDNTSTHYIRIWYCLKNGSYVERQFDFLSESNCKLFSELLETDGVKEMQNWYNGMISEE